MNIDLNKLSSFTWAILFFTAISIICPGILFIYIFHLEMFLKLDLLKLILVSISMTIPVWLLNYFFTFLETNDKKNGTSDIIHLGFLEASTLTFPVFYIPIIIGYFSCLSSKSAVMIGIAIQILISILHVFVFLLKKRSKSRN